MPMPTTVPERYYTVNEVADLLRVTPHCVRTWMRQGKLEYAKLGAHAQSPVRISQAQLEEFLSATLKPSA